MSILHISTRRKKNVYFIHNVKLSLPNKAHLGKGSTINNRPKTQNPDSPLRPAPSIRSYEQENFPPLRNLRGTNPWKIRQKKNFYCQTPQRKILRPSPNNSAFSPHRAKAQFHMPE